MKVVRFCLLALLLVAVSAYLELPLVRVPHKSKVEDAKPEPCPNQTLNKQYTQVCYLKDITHSIELYHHDELYLMAMDLTIPMSWIKGPECRLLNSSHACKRLEKSVREEIHNKLRTVKNKIREHFKKGQHETSENFTTIGSFDRIEGELEKATNVEFWTKDSDKLTSLYKILLIGLFLSDQKDRMQLNSTNFINASQVSEHTNRLSDGAVSLRFDDQSENSFLNQMFTFVGSTDKIVTVYLGSNSSVTIGDLSVKNAEKGYSGIEWIKLDDKRYPQIDQITIQTEGSEKVDSFECSAEALLTLSASYISLPEKYLTALIKHLSDVAKCHVSNNTFLECSITNSKKWSNKLVIFEIGETKLSFTLDELERSKSGSSKSMLLRQSETDFIVFGEPLFAKYFTVLDYQHNRIGVADRRVTFQERLFGIVTLIRILTFIFLSGTDVFKVRLSFHRNLVETIKLYYKINDYSKSSSSETKKLRYTGIQENPYEDLNRKVQDTLEDSVVEGI